MNLRSMTNADDAVVLALSAASEDPADRLTPNRLDWFRLIAAHAAVVEREGQLAGYVFTFAPGSAHDSLDFQWFTEKYADRFLHLDRVVVAEPHDWAEVAGLVYRAVERAARPFDRLVCRVRSGDEAALAFHADRGFTPLTTLPHPAVTLLTKELTG